jgi:HD superfamily phosphohydrolase
VLVADSMYGATEVPAWLDEVLLSPEVQRLRGIRLVNSSSPTLAALSDARRYTHTLGVLRLALAKSPELRGVGYREFQAFVIGAIVHDLATPPFGHVFEYLLKQEFGWSHERAVKGILDGQARPEGKYQQVLPGRELRLHAILPKIGVDSADISAVVLGDAPLGRLISGEVDLDNIDNVFRMASLLGLPGTKTSSAEILAASIHPSQGTSLHITPSGVDALADWVQTRARVYEVLAFDETNLAGQAMLSDCLTIAMQNGRVGHDHWTWTDEWLLYQLATELPTKDVVQRFIAGDLYQTLAIFWLDNSASDHEYRTPALRTKLSQAMSQTVGIPCSVYVFIDQGTFSKPLDVTVVGASDLWTNETAKRSCSTIIGVFATKGGASASSRRAALEVLRSHGFATKSQRSIPSARGIYGLSSQEELPF